MFGLDDPGISLAFCLSILSSVLCVVYGLTHWNKEGETEAEEMAEELEWEAEEKNIDDSL